MWSLLFEQTLNGLQFGVMLFLMAAGLTLVFGIMNFINLAHGSLYMVGAYLTVAATKWSGSYLAGVALGLGGTLIVGMLVEIVAARPLYDRDHLDQVLATFGLILFFNELVAILWGRAALFASGPSWLAGHIDLFTGSRYPMYRAAIIVVGLVTAIILWYVVTRTRLGMLIRAGATNRTMVAALGVNIRLLYTVVFGFGAALAGLAGLLAGPIYNVQPGMGELILIQVFVVILLALPPVVLAIGQPFYLDLTRRIMILAIAAVSLNLILGYGGMVSFGHAAYIGIGAYAVGILGFYGVFNGWLQILVAIAASALVALAIGAVSIRTSGIYFIMITLAFTQMLYYLGISVAEFGGDDGMRLKRRSQLGFVDLNDPVQFYYLVLVLMLLAVYVTYRIVNSRFGIVLRATKSNEARSRAIGISPYLYRLTAFVIPGAMCGLAGALSGNHTNYITPGLMSWQQSGDIMFMVILGGMASTAGPVLGAFALLLVEDLLSGWTQHWQVILGPLLILSVIFFRRGLAGIFYK